MKTIDELGKELSYELIDQYYEALTKALDGSDKGLPWEAGENPPTRKPYEAPLNEQIRAVSHELRLHNERFTVELLKRVFQQASDPSPSSAE